MSRNMVTRSLICRIQRHGSLQSSNMTRSVSGMDRGVNSGFRRGAKAGEDSDRKYIDNLASISILISCTPVSYTQDTYLLDLHLAHPDMYTRGQIHWQSPASSYVDPVGAWEHQRSRSQGILSAYPEFRLKSLQSLLRSTAISD